MTLLFTIIIILTGILISYIIAKNLPIFERLSIGFGLGILYYSFIPFLQVLNNIPLTKNSVYILISLSLVILILINIKNEMIVKDAKRINFSIFKHFSKNDSKYATTFIGVFSVVLTFVTLYFPISEWDALTLYDFRGKILSQGLLFKNIQYLDSFDKFNPGYYFSYPPSTSFIHALYYVLGANSPQIIYPLIFIGMVIFFYSALSKYISKDKALLLSVILMVSNMIVNNAAIPYTNLPYTFFYFISTILLVRYIFDKKDIGILLISAIFLAGSSWMRSVEPFYLINIIVFIFFLIRKQVTLKAAVFYTIPVLALRELWNITQKIYSTNAFLTNANVSTITSGVLSFTLNQISLPLAAFSGFIAQNVLLFSILTITIITYIINGFKKRLDPGELILIIVICNLGVILAGTFAVGILLPGRNEIYASIDRFGIFLFPFIVFISGLMLKDLFKN
jgi:hypothetical protein